MADAPEQGAREPGSPPAAPGNAHDSLFRALLADPEHADAFLRGLLSNDITGLFDDTPPVLQDGSFIDEALANSQCDLLYEVRLKSGRPAFVYVLMEHKSQSDPGVPLQLASYTIRIWRRWVKENPGKARALPPIVPLVVYQGAAAWTAPPSLAAAIDDGGASGLAFPAGFGYILRKLEEVSPEEFERRAQLRAGVVALQGRAMESMAEVLRTLPANSELRSQVLNYILRTYKDVGLAELLAAVRAADPEGDAEAEVGTIAQELIERGKAEGLVVGKAEGLAVGKAEGLAAGKTVGKAEGVAEGEAKSLLRLLERRFGSLPGWARERVSAASLEQLDAWLDGVLDARSPDDLLGGSKLS